MSSTADNLRGQAEHLQRHGRHREAIAAYRQLLALHPELADSWYNLGWLLRTVGEFEAALDAYEKALAAGVRAPEEVHLNRAVILSDHLRRDEEAVAELNAALALDPGFIPALLNLGNLREEQGDRDAAVACYERILSRVTSREASSAFACEALARLAHLRPPSGSDDPLLGHLEQAAANAKLDPVTRANLLFALGHALDGLGRFDDAFAAFARANRCVHGSGRAYRRQRAEQQVDAIIAAHAEAPPTGGASALRRRPEPVFICGMFRSGSTLLERVLGAHPRVVAAGELDFIPRLVRGVLAPFPASMRGLDAAGAAALAEDYRAHLELLFPHAREAQVVTDKRPDNFLLIGLIKRLFPAARIVHTVRAPLDNGLSVYFQHLQQSLASYSSDLGDIGHYYGQYRRLMAHWRHLFPEDIFDFDYDRFVSEPALVLKPLLAFLGLEWDERCLAFHETAGTVKTASYWQVRRPLYTHASGRWRHYAAHIEPLRTALSEAGVDPRD